MWGRDRFGGPAPDLWGSPKLMGHSQIYGALLHLWGSPKHLGRSRDYGAAPNLWAPHLPCPPRPSGRFSHHRRKKRREADEGLPDTPQQRSHRYGAGATAMGQQLPPNTPLWGRRHFYGAGDPAIGQELPPNPPLWGRSHPSMPPTPCYGAADTSMGQEALLWGSSCPLIPRYGAATISMGQEILPSFLWRAPAPPPSLPALLYGHMERWKRVRQRWREAGQRQQQRYGASLRLLRRIYERQ
uniref:Uncharacterized protein n=1 Tax=Anas zonorhyncha TaxID=75864 RepID=A0A8B9V1S4_9AVES